MPVFDVAKFTNAVKQENAKALREQAKPYHNQRLELAKKAQTEGREFTADESALDIELKNAVEAHIGAAQQIEASAGSYGNPLTLPVGSDALDPDGALGASRPTGAAFRNEAGMLLRAYRNGERLASEGVPGEIGNIVRDVWGDRRIQNAAIGADDPDGGYLLRPAQSGRLIDLARAASVVSRAGAQTIGMNDRDMHLLTVESDPTASWRAETVAIPASNPTFGRITLRSKTLAAIVPISLELAEDTSNGGQVIEGLLAKALAAELDRAALVGSGAGAEPRGIVNAAGVNTETGVGTPANWSDISSMVAKVYGQNYPGEPASLSLVYHPSVAAVYDGLVDTVNGQPLMPTPWAAAVKRHMTTKIPTTNMVIGDFSEVLIGVRQNVRIRVLQSGSATDSSGTTWNAADQLMYLIVAHLRADVAVMRPSYFTVASGVTTGS